MADSLSVAIGTVLSVLETVETRHGLISNVTLVEVNGRPTNVVTFELQGRKYEVLVTEAHPSILPHHKPSLHRVKLGEQVKGERSGKKRTGKRLTRTG